MQRHLSIALFLTALASTARAEEPSAAKTISVAEAPDTDTAPSAKPTLPATPIPATAIPATPVPDTAATATQIRDTEVPPPQSADTDLGAAKSTGEENVSPAAVPKDRIPVLQLSVTPKEAAVGEVVTWKLTVKRKAEDTVHLEGGASFGGLEIKAKDKSEMPGSDGWVIETLSVSLVGFDPGDITIPKQKLTVVDLEGHIADLSTDESFVTIKSLIANEPEPKLKEDKGPGEVVTEKDYLLLWILGIIGAIAVTVASTLLGRKLWSMRKLKPAPPPPPPRPAEEIANEKLEALRRSNLLAEGEIKEFHVRLSEAVREYIGNRFGFDSLELSSEELIQAVRRINLTRSEYELILDFLGETDLVKFAKALPTIQESEDLLTQSFGFVERTTPKIAPETAPKETAPDKKEADRA